MTRRGSRREHAREGVAGPERDGRAGRYELRNATLGEAHFVHACRVAGLRPYLEATWESWDEADQAERFCTVWDPGRYQVIVVDGQDAGVLAVDWDGGEVFVRDVEVLPAWRGRGLGTAVLRDIVAAARRSGRPVALQVLRVNPARRPYERLGFRTVCETATHVLMRTTRPSTTG